MKVTSLKTLVTVFSLCLAMIAPTLAQNRRNCRDQNKSCKLWAHRGECQNNGAFMYIYCPDTCGQCKVYDDKCTDLEAMCMGWAQRGECRGNKPFMEKMCPRACAFCTPASDHSVPHVHSNVVARMWRAWSQKSPVA